VQVYCTASSDIFIPEARKNILLVYTYNILYLNRSHAIDSGGHALVQPFVLSLVTSQLLYPMAMIHEPLRKSANLLRDLFVILPLRLYEDHVENGSRGTSLGHRFSALGALA
jgi:hypothetical protein